MDSTLVRYCFSSVLMVFWVLSQMMSRSFPPQERQNDLQKLAGNLVYPSQCM